MLSHTQSGKIFAVVTSILTLALGLLAPEPSPVPKRWQLDFEPGDLRVITVDIPELGPRSYFYMDFKVTNRSGEDLIFAPIFELSLADGDPIRSGRNVQRLATAEIKAQLQDPLILEQIDFAGKQILQGEEHHIRGVVVWPAEDLTPNDLSIYVSGLSGETVTIPVPDSEETVTLRKTRHMTYQLPGDLTGQSTDPIPQQNARWIMR